MDVEGTTNMTRIRHKKVLLNGLNLHTYLNFCHNNNFVSYFYIYNAKMLEAFLHWSK